MVAEGEELQTNLLQASQRIPANSSVPDEVFGIHTGLAGEEVQMAPALLVIPADREPCKIVAAGTPETPNGGVGADG
jgi:hypothetical protein